MRTAASAIFASILALISIVFVFAIIASIPTWLLWNWLMPHIFGLPTISLLQALGLNILAGILFKSSSHKYEKKTSWN